MVNVIPAPRTNTSATNTHPRIFPSFFMSLSRAPFAQHTHDLRDDLADHFDSWRFVNACETNTCSEPFTKSITGTEKFLQDDSPGITDAGDDLSSCLWSPHSLVFTLNRNRNSATFLEADTCC